MGGTYAVVVGDKGRIVLPVALRARLGLTPGTSLLLLETDQGVVMTTREQGRRLLREQIDGPGLVEGLLEDRRRAAAAEDA